MQYRNKRNRVVYPCGQHHCPSPSSPSPPSLPCSGIHDATPTNNPMEKRLPPPRQAFQPSRSRLLQPNQPFKPTRPTTRPIKPSESLPQQSNSLPQQPERKPTDPPKPPPSDSHTDNSIRVPRLPSNISKPAKPFILAKKPTNPPNLAPFLSNSRVKAPSFPLRSSNQSIFQPTKQPVLQSATRKAHKPALQEQEQLSEPHPLKSSAVRAVPPTSAQPQRTESANSHHSASTVRNVSAQSTPCDGAVQQPTVPFPLSTIPHQVLQSMSEDKKDGFKAGWAAGWDAYAQYMHSAQNQSSTSPAVTVPATILSSTQINCLLTKQHSPPQATPIALAESSQPSSATTPPRRKLPDPYEADERGRKPVKVGANKRPRPLAPANPYTLSSRNTSVPSSGQLPYSAPKFLKSPSTDTATVRPSSSIQAEHRGAQSGQRSNGLDAYMARQRLGTAQSTDAAFMAATTTDPVEYRTKRRKQNNPAPSSDTLRPAEKRTASEVRGPGDSGARRKPQQTTQTRSGQDTGLPPWIRPQQEPSRAPETRIRQQAQPPFKSRHRQKPNRSSKTHQDVGRLCPQPTEARTISQSGFKKHLSPSNNNGDKIRSQRAAPTTVASASHSLNATTRRASVDASSTRPVVSAQTEKSVPNIPNGVQVVQRPTPNFAIANGSLPHLDNVRASSESQGGEESGWGSALKAMASRDHRETSLPNASASGKRLGIHGNETEKLQKPSNQAQQDLHPRQSCEVTNSADTLTDKERDDVMVQAYAERFGLVIVKRDGDSGKVEWVACKFCPVFGCRTRDPDYIMAHRAPFSLKKFLGHLEKDHCLKWKEYAQANAEEKSRFFSGKVLPARAFHDRVAELKRSQDGMARRRATPQVTTDEQNSKVDKAVENLAKQHAADSVKTMELNYECWIGRERFQDHPQCNTVTVSKGKRKSIGIGTKFPPIERIQACVKEVEIDSSIAGLILHGTLKEIHGEGYETNHGFTDTIVLDGEEMRPTTLIFSNVDETIALRMALTLRYLNSGVTATTCMALLRDDLGAGECQSTGDCTGKEVFGHGNAWMALGMQVLMSALNADWQSWAVGLTTRSCHYVTKSAVEVLISLRDDNGELRKAHLITVQEDVSAGAAVAQMLDVILPSWKRRLVGVHSEICKETHSYEKQIESAVLDCFRKLTGRDLLLIEHDTGIDEKPIFPWVLSGMCESKFEALMCIIGLPIGIALGKARVRAAKVQRHDLFRRKLTGGSEREIFREAWNATGERATEIYVVAEGLRSIYMCDCNEDGAIGGKGQAGEEGMVVDSEAERVLWARSLVRLWQWCSKAAKELGMETP